MKTTSRKDTSGPKAKSEGGHAVASPNELLSPYLRQLCTQFLTPIASAGRPLEVSPASYPSQVCARHLHKVVDVSTATPAFANGFTAVMSPDLYMPGSVSAPANALILSAGPGLVSLAGRAHARADGSGRWHAKFSSNTEEAFLSARPITDSGGVSHLGFNLTPAALQVLSVGLTNKSGTGKPAHMIIYSKVAGAAWTILEDSTMTPSSGAFFERTLPANSDAIAFAGADVVDEIVILVGMCLKAGQFSALADAALLPGFSRFVIDNEVTYGRVLAMSLLATNTSPELSNGGNISIGRVPREFDLFSGIVDQMSSLPDNRRYQGPANTGGYVTWLPSQWDEYEIDSLANKREAYSESEYLVCRVDGWAPPAGSVSSFRLQFDWIVEFYTPNQIFEKEITPPLSEEFRALYYMMLALPAATCNPEHEKLLRSLLANGQSVLRRGVQFYGKHKSTIDGLTKLILSALL